MNARIEGSENPKGIRISEPTGLSTIKDLVRRHKVCWEVFPERALVKPGIRSIGFALELYGTHEPGTEHVDPGCENCRKVQSDLREIADWILPKEERPSMYQVEIETQSLTYSRERGDRPDVRVTIHIVHRHDWEQPVDACEVRCLKEMEQELGELGACAGAWSNQRNDTRLHSKEASYGR
jgi:hypothetical protein